MFIIVTIGTKGPLTLRKNPNPNPIRLNFYQIKHFFCVPNLQNYDLVLLWAVFSSF